MLDPCYCVLVESSGEKDKEDVRTNWLDIKEDLVNLLSHRVSTSDYPWYNENYLDCLSMIQRFSPETSDSINFLPQGILGEVFFLNACRQNGIRCEPCFGGDDVDGMDFKLTDSIGDKYVDVTINLSNRGVHRKINRNTFPTIFLPWTYRNANSVHPRITYAHQYMRSGSFDGREFLERTVDINYEILCCIKRELFGDEKVKSKKICGKNYSDFSGSDIPYVYEMEEVLYMIRANM